MRIVLDTDKKTITVPWNYAAKLDELNGIIEQGAAAKIRLQKLSDRNVGYVQERY